MSNSFSSSMQSQKTLTIEEFGKLIESKNKAFVEEKKSNYYYVDCTNKERSLTPTAIKIVEESSINLSSKRDDMSCNLKMSSTASTFSLESLRTKRLKLVRPKRLIENPFRKIASVIMESRRKDFCSGANNFSRKLKLD